MRLYSHVCSLLITQLVKFIRLPISLHRRVFTGARHDSLRQYSYRSPARWLPVPPHKEQIDSLAGDVNRIAPARSPGRSPPSDPDRMASATE